MKQQSASRTLVKSHPELWSECSDAASLARHLGAFGEIRITRLEPESTVAWEGAQVSGTVQLEPAGWGTRVTLTVQDEAVGEGPMPGPPAPPGPEPEPPTPTPPGPGPDPEPPPEPPTPQPPQPPPGEPLPPAAQAAPRKPMGKLAWLKSFFFGEPEIEESEYVPSAEPAPPVEAPAPAPPEPPQPQAESIPELDAALESLGQAHHRPFSRA